MKTPAQSLFCIRGILFLVIFALAAPSSSATDKAPLEPPTLPFVADSVNGARWEGATSAIQAAPAAEAAHDELTSAPAPDPAHPHKARSWRDAHRNELVVVEEYYGGGSGEDHPMGDRFRLRTPADPKRDQVVVTATGGDAILSVSTKDHSSAQWIEVRHFITLAQTASGLCHVSHRAAAPLAEFQGGHPPGSG